jgi:hypothetical protein
MEIIKNPTIIRIPPKTTLSVNVSLRKIIPKMTEKTGKVKVAKVIVKTLRPLCIPEIKKIWAKNQEVKP